MIVFSWWAVRFGLLLAGFGVFLSFAKGDGPAPNWSFFEQVGQSLAAALIFGSGGAIFGLGFDLLGMMFRRTRKFSKDIRDLDERTS